MQITVKETDMKIVGGNLVININADLEKALGLNKMVLSSVKPGDIILGDTGTEWIVFRHDEDGTTKLLRKNLLTENRKFDSECNNFAVSGINDYLNTTYSKEVENDFGSENVKYQDIDLLSLDGLEDYGTCRVKIALLTIDDYRYGRRNGIIKKNMPRWWWLLTPNSTPSGWLSSFVRCVFGGGFVGYDGYGCSGGVRPFCSIQSSIFVSSPTK